MGKCQKFTWKLACTVLIISFVFSPGLNTLAASADRSIDLKTDSQKESLKNDSSLLESPSLEKISDRIEEKKTDLKQEEITLAPEEQEPIAEPTKTAQLTSTIVPFQYKEEAKNGKIKIDKDSLTGALNYSYNLDLPPGRNNLNPDLSLSYNSQDKHNDSFLGYGWSLNIPSIERDRKKGVKEMYDGNDFTSSLSGELKFIKTENGRDYYGARTENTSFLNYQFSPSENIWRVYDKQGGIYTFGDASGLSQQSSQNKTAKWLLAEFRDANNNYIQYEYTKDNNQVYPDKIFYGGNGSSTGIFEIDFIKEIRPDQSYNYSTGFLVLNNYRLKEIQAKINGVWVTKYTLDYGLGINGVRSLLTGITKSGRDESNNITSLPTEQFEYQEKQEGWTLRTNLNLPFIFSSLDNGSSAAGLGIQIADLNGDGLDDVFNGANYAFTYSKRPDDTGWNNSSPFYSWNPRCPLVGSIGQDIGTRIFDANGDYLPDFVCSRGMGTYNNQYVFLNSSSGYGGQNLNWVIPVGFADTSEDYGVRLADVNGDGYLDILRSYYQSSPSVQTIIQTWIAKPEQMTWALDSNYQIPVIFYNKDVLRGAIMIITDANGDGLDDILVNSNYESGNYINKGDGTGWATSTIALPVSLADSYNGYRDNGVRMADINGDGLSDIISPGANDTSVVYVGYGRGWSLNNFHSFTVPISTVLGNTGADHGARFFDANNDGQTDVVSSYISNNNEYKKIYESNGLASDILSKIRHSQGDEIKIEYKSLASYLDSADQLLNPKARSNPYVVASITTNDGLGNSYTKSFSYSGAEYYYAGPYDRKFAGFQSIKETDENSGNYSISYYHQGNGNASSSQETDDSFFKIGQSYRKEIYGADNKLYQVNLTKFNDNDLGNDRHFVATKDSLEQSHNQSGNHRDKAVSYEYDSFGNLTKQINYGEVTTNNYGSFSDFGDDLNIKIISYATNNTIYLPKQELLTDYQGNKISEKKYYYDNQPFGSLTKGNLSEQDDWIENNTPLFLPEEARDNSHSNFKSSLNQYIESQEMYGDHYAVSKKYYNQFGLISQEIDPRQQSTTYTYDANNLYPATITNAKNQTVSLLYNYSNGQVKQLTDANQAIYKTTYDGLGRVLSEEQSDTATPGNLVLKTVYNYNDVSYPKSVKETKYFNTNDSADTWRYFDSYNRLIQTRSQVEGNNNYAVKDYSYNSQGLVSQESLPYFSAGANFATFTANQNLNIYTTYDALNRPLKITNALGDTIYEYDRWDTKITDAEENYKIYSRDANDNLTSVTEHNAGNDYQTFYYYNPLNKLIKLVDALGNVRNFVFDGLGKITLSEDLHAANDNTFGVYYYTYDASGNLIRQTDPKKQITVYSYDPLNRVISEDYTASSGIEIIYNYDSCNNGIGRVCSIITSNITTDYQYDLLGRIISENRLYPSSQTAKSINNYQYTTQYNYDRQGNVTTNRYPDNSLIKYEYNFGLLNTVAYSNDGQSITQPLLTNIDYNPQGQITRRDYGNGTISLYNYNPNKLYLLEQIKTTALPTAPSGPIVAKDELLSAKKILENIVTEKKSLIATKQAITQKDGSVLLNEPREIVQESKKNSKTFLLGYTKNNSLIKKIKAYSNLLNAPSKAGSKSLLATSSGISLSNQSSSGSGSISFYDNYYTWNWPMAHDATAGTLLDNEYYISAVFSAASNNYRIVRGFMSFDTTAIPLNANVTQAKVFGTLFSSGNSFFGDFRSFITVVQGFQNSSTALSLNDYDNIGLIEGVDQNKRYVSNCTGNSINTCDTSMKNKQIFFELNSTGRSWINKGAWTKLALREGHDLLNSSYSLPGSSDYAPGSGIYLYARAINNINNGDPYLEVVYTIPPSPSYAPYQLKMNQQFSPAIATSSNNLSFSATYNSANASSTASSSWIQISTSSSDWSNPVWDSGTMPLSGSSMIGQTAILSAVNINNLQNGQTYYWRIKFFDNNNLEGDWSTGQDSFTIIGGDLLIQDISYTYDQVGNITKINDGSQTSNAKIIDYHYDNLYRLISATTTAAVNNQNYNQTYSYNPIGNIIAKSDLGAYSYSQTGFTNPQAVTQIGNKLYTYDNNGNTLSDSVWQYTWDYRNRLLKTQQGTTTVIYSYDTDNNRASSLSGNITTYYPNKGYNITSAGSKTKQVFANSQLIATINNTSTSTSLHYVHPDHLGGTNVVTDNTGHLEETIDYYPYGEIRIDQKNSSFNEKRKYTGHEYDEETGLNYMAARYQDGRMGRFLSQDRVFVEMGKQDLGKILSDPQGLNSYAYARNNPLKYFDPNGQWFKEFFAGRQSWSDFNLELGDAGNQLYNQSATARNIMDHPAATGITVGVAGGLAAAGGAAVITSLSTTYFGGAGTACLFNCGKITQNTPKLVEQGFNSYRAFVKAMGKADPSGQNLRQWHHIVEQNPSNIQKFGQEALQNKENILNIQKDIHQKISGYYSSIDPSVTGSTHMKVRDWISQQSFAEQLSFGKKILSSFSSK